MPHAAQFFTVFIMSAVLTGAFRQLALRTAILDHPVARSAHSRATPLGGGLAIVLLFLGATLFTYLDGGIPYTALMALYGGVLIAVVGLIDDLWQLDIRWRVPAQLLAAAWVLGWLGEIPPIDLFGLQVGGLTLYILAALALVWLTNLYNFMDGIDGLAGSELVFVSAVSFFLVINSGATVMVSGALTLAAAGLGFLLWNWPPARIFMGDTGSGFVGFILGVLAIISLQQGSLTLWAWLLLLGVFVVDATVTLLRRFLSGQKWYEGHACHAYQKAARKYQSHGKVTITVIAINCLWLAPLAWLTGIFPEQGIYLCLLGIIPLILLAWHLEAGKPDPINEVMSSQALP